MIAVAVTDTMKVTANVITTATPVDNPELSDASVQSPMEYNKAQLTMNYDNKRWTSINTCI